MGSAEAGTRSYYLDDFVCEVLPCGTSLPEWAEWLGSEPQKDEDGYPEWGREGPAKDGDTFDGSATLWQEDIVATRADGKWWLSRPPGDEDFVAVRYAQGLGWSPDNIVNAAIELVDGAYRRTQTMEQALLAWLSDPENEEFADDVEFVAVGTHEPGYRFTFRAGPPPMLEAERMQ